VTTLAGNGSNWHIDGPPGIGTLCSPQTVVVDLVGNLYVGDACSTDARWRSVRTVSPGGTVGTLAGGGNAGPAANPCPTKPPLSLPSLSPDGTSSSFQVMHGNSQG
jgi:hypothetical protein